ncbi:hypothetical protein [Sinomonas flava]|uniref:hypothetical protein n=1 Tax=Sinomonas flava TaxID=496857 RepID=UPI0039A6D086
MDVFGSENVQWLDGHGPRPTRLYRGDCQHHLTHAVAWGWDPRHYELAQCDNADCRSRAWTDEDAKATTPWMEEDGKDFLWPGFPPPPDQCPGP